MTRPKVPTIAELRAFCRSCFGEGTIVNVSRSVSGWRNAWVSFEEGETIECTAPNGAAAKRMLMICLQALPSHSAPTPKKRKGAKR